MRRTRASYIVHMHHVPKMLHFQGVGYLCRPKQKPFFGLQSYSMYPFCSFITLSLADENIRKALPHFKRKNRIWRLESVRKAPRWKAGVGLVQQTTAVEGVLTTLYSQLSTRSTRLYHLLSCSENTQTTQLFHNTI